MDSTTRRAINDLIEKTPIAAIPTQLLADVVIEMKKQTAEQRERAERAEAALAAAVASIEFDCEYGMTTPVGRARQRKALEQARAALPKEGAKSE